MVDSSESKTLVDILRHRARTTPDKTAYIFLEDGEDAEVRITYAELDQKAREVAAAMQAMNPDVRNTRVLLIYPQGIDFIVAFFGCLYSGGTAVLLYPPTSMKMAQRLGGIVKDCAVSLILSSQKINEKVSRLGIVGGETSGTEQSSPFANMPWINTDSLEPGLSSEYREQSVGPDDLAFLQYTSGSTGTPKGVMISHGNLVANQETIQAIYGNTEESVVVGWLPLIHDMGLIGNVLQPMYVGCPLIFMSPMHFIQKPSRWLRAIHKYRATVSGGPNFSYDLCAKKISQAEKEELDLSSWTIAFNGAEPVRKETIERFRTSFEPHGFNPSSLIAVYGLAEATLIVSGTRRGELLTLDSELSHVSSGQTQSTEVVKVVNPDTCEEVSEGCEGEVWLSSPSVAQGYWNRPDATNETFKARMKGCDRNYLRTGDTAYSVDGNLHITGRIKDVIIFQGRNYHPEDLEWSIDGLRGVRIGCCAAFSINVASREELVMVVGVTTTDLDAQTALVEQIKARVYEDHQLHLNRVALIEPRELPVTTSGKVRRKRAREMYLGSEFNLLLDVQDTPVAKTADGETTGTVIIPAKTEAEIELV
ncbi:MAG: fatty acyl-AMP ligase, partial [Reinekea sp.]|nr:fatty acyl-AMP ligase [Reinekea sp.]